MGRRKRKPRGRNRQSRGAAAASTASLAPIINYVQQTSKFLATCRRLLREAKRRLEQKQNVAAQKQQLMALVAEMRERSLLCSLSKVQQNTVAEILSYIVAIVPILVPKDPESLFELLSLGVLLGARLPDFAGINEFYSKIALLPLSESEKAEIESRIKEKIVARLCEFFDVLANRDNTFSINAGMYLAIFNLANLIKVYGEPDYKTFALLAISELNLGNFEQAVAGFGEALGNCGDAEGQLKIRAKLLLLKARALELAHRYSEALLFYKAAQAPLGKSEGHQIRVMLLQGDNAAATELAGRYLKLCEISQSLHVVLKGEAAKVGRIYYYLALASQNESTREKYIVETLRRWQSEIGSETDLYLVLNELITIINLPADNWCDPRVCGLLCEKLLRFPEVVEAAFYKKAMLITDLIGKVFIASLPKLLECNDNQKIKKICGLIIQIAEQSPTIIRPGDFFDALLHPSLDNSFFHVLVKLARLVDLDSYDGANREKVQNICANPTEIKRIMRDYAHPPLSDDLRALIAIDAAAHSRRRCSKRRNRKRTSLAAPKSQPVIVNHE